MILAHIGALLSAVLGGSQGDPETEPIAIRIVETGVARNYSASKTIACGAYEWRVAWRSSSDEAFISGDVVVVVDGRSYDLGDAQTELFGRFSNLNSVSATCNRGTGEMPTRTRLLVSGYDLETGREAFAQVSIDDDGEAMWSYDTE